MSEDAKATTETIEKPTEDLSVLSGVTTPLGDAKQQARTAKQAALAAAKAKIAENANGNAKNGTPKAETPTEPKDDAPASSGDAPEATEDKAEEKTPEPKAETPAPLTTEQKLRELIALSEDRTDHEATLVQLRAGIAAIAEDLANEAPKPKTPREPKAVTAEGKALEEAAMKLLVETKVFTMGELHTAVGAKSGDPKPRAAVDRLIKAGKVVREKDGKKVVHKLVEAEESPKEDATVAA